MCFSERHNLDQKSNVEESGDTAARKSHCAQVSCSHSTQFLRYSSVSNAGVRSYNHVCYFVAFPMSEPPPTFVETTHVFSHDFVTLDEHSWQCMLAGPSRLP